MSELLFYFPLLYHKHKMNPQQPGTNTPPQDHMPEPQAAPPQPVINVPGQAPFVAAPVQPADLQHIDHSPYEFILNPSQPPRRNGPLKLSGASLPKRLMVILGGALVAVIAVSLVMSALNSGSGGAAYLPVLQEQTELMRIAAIGENNAQAQDTKNLAYSLQLSVASQNQSLSSYLASNKIKPDPKLLGARRSTTADTQLQSAQQNGTYDQAFVSVVENDLNDYAQMLQTAYKSTKGPKGRQLLSTTYDGVQLLLQQAKQQ